MGAAAHPVTSDKSRSSGLDRWLALPILGDLDPYPPATAPSAPLPTGCPKSPFDAHIAEDGVLRWDALQEDTQRAFVRVAAAISHAFSQRVSQTGVGQ